MRSRKEIASGNLDSPQNQASRAAAAGITLAVLPCLTMPAAPISFDTLAGEAARDAPEALELCRLIFDPFDPAYLESRLPGVDRPALSRALDGDGSLVGFKLGYRLSVTVFYSWLGGVHPDWRGQGIAARLMREQHLWCAKQGFRSVETRTRVTNIPMIMLNLRSGFLICGFEINSGGHQVVTQRCNVHARN